MKNKKRKVRVRFVGEDYWNNRLYHDIDTNKVYVEVDDHLHSRTPEGEPDSPLRNFTLEIVTDEEQKKQTKMEDINDTQNQAIWDTIGKEHDKLTSMYDNKIALKKEHTRQLNDTDEAIAQQEKKVRELCEGKATTYVSEEGKLILDLTDEGVKIL